MTLKEEIEDILHPENKMLKVAVERLHPPSPIASEKSVEGVGVGFAAHRGMSPRNETDSKLTIDFNAIANASEFRRFIYWIRTGRVFRGSNEKLTIELNKTQEELEIIKAIPKYKEFTGVIAEFKSKLTKLKEKSDGS